MESGFVFPNVLNRGINFHLLTSEIWKAVRDLLLVRGLLVMGGEVQGESI